MNANEKVALITGANKGLGLEIARQPTDLNQHREEQTIEEGAIEPVRLALLNDDEPTGGFFEQDGELS